MDEKIKYQLLSIILTFSGVIIGTTVTLVTLYYTGEQNKNLWLRTSIEQQRNSILEKRINLIERASLIFNSRNDIIDINRYLKIQSDFAKEASNCAKSPIKYKMSLIECKQLMDTDETFKKLKDKNKINSEFSSLLQLISLYFGEKSKIKAEELSKEKKWWLVKNEDFGKMIKVMNNELYEFKYSITNPKLINN